MLIHEFVTGGGLAGEAIPPSWKAEGQAMRRALAEDFATLDGVNVVITLDLSLPDEPGPWRVERVGPGEEPATFARLARECDLVLCVAPETGGVLEDRARTIVGRTLGCSPEAIALCADKIRLGEHLRELGVETPRTLRVVPSEGLPRDISYPAVLKPIDGAGSLDTFLLEGPDSLPASALAMKEAILQPFVSGDPLSASFLIPREREPIWIGLGRQRMMRDDGAFHYEGGDVPWEIGDGLEELRSLLLRVVKAIPGLGGWIGIDLIHDPTTGRVTVLEINPRVTTSIIGWRRLANGQGGLAALWLGREQGEFCVPKGRTARFLADGDVQVEESP